MRAMSRSTALELSSVRRGTGFRQNSGPMAYKAPDPVFPSLGLRFETRLRLLTFLAELGAEP